MQSFWELCNGFYLSGEQKLSMVTSGYYKLLWTMSYRRSEEKLHAKAIPEQLTYSTFQAIKKVNIEMFSYQNLRLALNDNEVYL